MFYEPVVSYSTLRDGVLLSGLVWCAGHFQSPGGLNRGSRGKLRWVNWKEKECVAESIAFDKLYNVFFLFFYITCLISHQTVAYHITGGPVCTINSLKCNKTLTNCFILIQAVSRSTLTTTCQRCRYVVVQQGCLPTTSRPAVYVNS